MAKRLQITIQRSTVKGYVTKHDSWQQKLLLDSNNTNLSWQVLLDSNINLTQQQTGCWTGAITASRKNNISIICIYIYIYISASNINHHPAMVVPTSQIWPYVPPQITGWSSMDWCRCPCRSCNSFGTSTKNHLHAYSLNETQCFG